MHAMRLSRDRESPGGRFRAMLAAKPYRERDHAIRRVDVLHRLLDGPLGAWPGAGRTWLRVGLGCRALAHSAVAPNAVRGRRRAAETLLRCDGPVRCPHRRRDGDEDLEGRDRGVSGEPARPDPDGQAGGLDRPDLRRPVLVWDRQRLEPGRDGKSWHRVRYAA